MNPQITIHPNRTSVTVEPRATTIAPIEHSQTIVEEQSRPAITRVGIQGPSGPPGQGSGSGALKFPFAFGDASPCNLLTIAAGTTVFTATLVIQTSFNGIGATLRLGDTNQSDRLIAANQNDPLRSAEYETNPGYTYDHTAQLLLTITPGAGCTQGAGYVLLEV